MRLTPPAVRVIALVSVAIPWALCAQAQAALPQAPTMTIEQARDEQIKPPLPLKHTPEPTTAAITAADLMTRLYILADDSMLGRETGTIGHVRATNYIASELKKLGLKPAGDSGSYFQNVPVILRMLDSTSTISVDGIPFALGVGFLAVAPGGGRGPATPLQSFPSGQVVYGGDAADTSNALTPDQVRGKIVLLRGGRGGGGRAGGGARAGGAGNLGGGRGGGRGAQAPNPLAGAMAVVSIVDSISRQQLRTAIHPREGSVSLAPVATAAPQLPTVTVTPALAEALLGTSLASAKKGQTGKTLHADIRFIDATRPARNVVAILPGADPKLAGEYVAIGAHNDHVGIANVPVDHDSVRLYNSQLRTQGLENRTPATPTSAQAVALRLALDSIHTIHGVHLDSINNGADDDGSGTVTELEIAEAFAKARARPKRSILFVWHVGEEKGLWGSDYFTQHPTVPRDSIVAQLNMDMVGRGKAEDIPGGGPDYVEPVGWKRLSSELGVMALDVNNKEKPPFRFDSVYDAPFQSNNIYCRSDHANYARFGIPISYFTTGLHRDYHQVTDEPQYIDYPHMARVGQFMYDLAVATANAANRPKVDGNVPRNPLAACVNNGVVPDSLAIKAGGRGWGPSVGALPGLFACFVVFGVGPSGPTAMPINRRGVGRSAW